MDTLENRAIGRSRSRRPTFDLVSGFLTGLPVWQAESLLPQELWYLFGAELRREGEDMSLFATKSLDHLLKEAQESGEHSLKRTLGPFQLTALGVGAIIGAGIFVLSGPGRALRRPGLDAVVRAVGLGLRLRRAVLRGIRGHDSAGWQRLHLRLCDAGRASRVDHRLGSDTRVRDGRQHGVVGLVEPLYRAAEHLQHQDAVVARVRPLDGAQDGREYRRAADGDGGGSEPRPGHAVVFEQGDGDHRRRNRPTSCSEPGSC